MLKDLGRLAAACVAWIIAIIISGNFGMAQEATLIDKLVICKNDTVISGPILLGPNAHFMATQPCNLSFQESVRMVSETHLFGRGLSVDFAEGQIESIRPAWYGASGQDAEDDTDAFQRALETASRLGSTVKVAVSVGRYYISDILYIQSEGKPGRTVNLVGGGKSNNSIEGASLSWTGRPGGTMIVIRNVNQIIVEGLDFTSEPGHRLEANIRFKPFVHQVLVRDCTFTGVAGQNATNISLNEGDGDQVSEIRFDNCSFNSLVGEGEQTSGRALSGGLANTKNFYVANCAFSGYSQSAIDILISDVVEVRNCTFANNDLDISCGLCGLRAESNYSEHSAAFFKGSSSSNIAFTTLLNNRFCGSPRDGFVIQDGSGSLVMMNNDFGGSDQRDDANNVRWEDRNQSSIYSVGNFFKNSSPAQLPFYNRSGHPYSGPLTSIHDKGGRNGPAKILLGE